MIMPRLRGLMHRLVPICLAGACIGALSVVAGAPTARAEPDPSAAPSPSDAPSPTDPATDPAPPPPTGTADPVAGVRLQASDLTLGDGYWRGTATGGDVTIAVTNTASPAVAEDVMLTFTLPAGVSQARAASTAGCAGGGRSYSCGLGPGGSASVVLHLAVDAGAWRSAPLHGTAVAQAAIAGRPDLPVGTAHAGYTVILPPGPPVPGVRLSAADLAVGPADRERGRLSVRLANLGAVWTSGALELVTPEGVDVVGFPSDCTSHRRVGGGRDRCELGRLDPGVERVLVFTVAVSAEALAQAPLTGAVHAFLTPEGQDTVIVQAAYRIVPAGSPAVSGTTPSAAGGGGRANHPVPPIADSLISHQLSAGSLIGGLVTLVALAGALFVLSLRRRMRDAEPVPPSGGEASM